MPRAADRATLGRLPAGDSDLDDLWIAFVALSLAVLFYGIQSNAFYTKFVAILFVVATMLEIGSLF